MMSSDTAESLLGKVLRKLRLHEATPACLYGDDLPLPPQDRLTEYVVPSVSYLFLVFSL
jgi:hypothetical protein